MRRVLAIAALVFMGIFTVTFVITLVDPKLCHGAFGYAALVSALLGVGLYLLLRFALQPKGEAEYLPDPDNDDARQNDVESASSSDTQNDENGKNDPSSDTQSDEKDG